MESRRGAYALGIEPSRIGLALLEDVRLRVQHPCQALELDKALVEKEEFPREPDVMPRGELYVVHEELPHLHVTEGTAEVANHGVVIVLLAGRHVSGLRKEP